MGVEGSHFRSALGGDPVTLLFVEPDRLIAFCELEGKPPTQALVSSVQSFSLSFPFKGEVSALGSPTPTPTLQFTGFSLLIILKSSWSD